MSLAGSHKQFREIVLDTETTGLSLHDRHRIIEIGCVELVNKVKTGAYFHTYVNPQREVDPGAFKVHNISNEFLTNKPLFRQISKDFLKFIADSKLIIHNAPFDTQFLNQELVLMGFLPLDKSRVLDTLVMARRKYPGSPASLDALCRKFGISLEGRAKHGALVDAELLASVYIAMHTKSQPSIEFLQEQNPIPENDIVQLIAGRSSRRKRITEQELKLHASFLEKIRNPLWHGGTQ